MDRSAHRTHHVALTIRTGGREKLGQLRIMRSEGFSRHSQLLSCTLGSARGCRLLGRETVFEIVGLRRERTHNAALTSYQLRGQLHVP